LPSPTLARANTTRQQRCPRGVAGTGTRGAGRLSPSESLCSPLHQPPPAQEGRGAAGGAAREPASACPQVPGGQDGSGVSAAGDPPAQPPRQGARAPRSLTSPPGCRWVADFRPPPRTRRAGGLPRPRSNKSGV